MEWNKKEERERKEKGEEKRQKTQEIINKREERKKIREERRDQTQQDLADIQRQTDQLKRDMWQRIHTIQNRTNATLNGARGGVRDAGGNR